MFPLLRTLHVVSRRHESTHPTVMMSVRGERGKRCSATVAGQSWVATAFGQTCFGHPYLAAFGQTEFGQYHIWPKFTGRIWPSLFDRIWPIFVDRIWPDRIWPIFCFGEGPQGWGPNGVGAEGGPEGWGPNPEKVGGQTQKKWGPEGWGPEGWGPEGWGPEGWSPEGWSPDWWGPEGWGPRRVGAQTQKKWGPEGWGPEGWSPEGWRPKISRFFFPLPPQNLFFSSLSGGLLVEFWWCLKRRGAQMCTFGVLGLSCASPGGPVWWGRRGFTRQPESPNVHISGSRFSKTPTKFHERTPRERKKNESCGGRREKKSEIWAVQGKGLPAEGVRVRGPEHTHHTHKQQPPTTTNNHQQAPTGTNRHQQAPTGTNRHQQAPTGTNRHQQEQTTTKTTSNNNNNRKFGQNTGQMRSTL